MVLKKIVKGIKNPRILAYYILSCRIARIIPDKTLVKLKYKASTGKKLNLDNPLAYNEKLQWLKLYDRKPEYAMLVDKVEVRKHISATIGEEYLVPLLGIYDTYNEIDFDGLPNQFVLKPNHTSGDIYICQDKSIIDYKAVEKLVRKWLKKEYYWISREWPYKNVKPKIICEQYITENNKSPDDYKVLCFNGKAKLVEMHLDRFTNHLQDIYDTEWNRTEIIWGFEQSERPSSILQKPEKLEEMIELSEKLAAHLYQGRIDWYIVQGKLFFGEITFFDGAGFMPFENDEDDLLLGSWLELPI